jgi:hypothetical protein
VALRKQILFLIATPPSSAPLAIPEGKKHDQWTVLRSEIGNLKDLLRDADQKGRIADRGGDATQRSLVLPEERRTELEIGVETQRNQVARLTVVHQEMTHELKILPASLSGKPDPSVELQGREFLKVTPQGKLLWPNMKK